MNTNLKDDYGVLHATSFAYQNLVNYQDGAIVSRTIIDAPAGTVTVFAFDKGQRLSEHTVPFDALIEIVDGTGTKLLMAWILQLKKANR
jgi:quercetin dioxygenase-like cupin family protein